MAAMNLLLTLARLRWRWVRWTRQPGGWPSMLLLALAALVASLVWHGQTQQRWQAQQTARTIAPTPASLSTTAERRLVLQQFDAALPAPVDLPVTVQSLIDLAEQQGLQLSRGSYRLDHDRAARFSRYRMNLPVRGDAARVQQFIQAALLAFPTLAIESLQFKREVGAGRLLTVRMQWVLYLRTEAPDDTWRAVRLPGVHQETP